MKELLDLFIIVDYRKLKNVRAVADAYGYRSLTSIYRVLKRNNVNINRNGNYGGGSPIKITDEQLIEACKTMTLNEIAEEYDMHPQSLPRRFKRLNTEPVGYHTGGGFNEGGNTEAANQYWLDHPDEQRGCMPVKTFGDCWHFVESQWKTFEAKHPDFQYLETRTKLDTHTKRVRLKCKKCGTVIERSESTVRQKNIKCDKCEADKKIDDARQSVLSVFIAIASSKTPRPCVVCGELFTSSYSTQKYCSTKCKEKSKRKNHSYRSRCRHYGVYYDSSVTREAVVERDNNICQICGKICDPSDKRWGSSGPNYPTLDHIVALAKGGPHTWENCQCACGWCNSNKRDLPMEVIA